MPHREGRLRSQLQLPPPFLSRRPLPRPPPLAPAPMQTYQPKPKPSRPPARPARANSLRKRKPKAAAATAWSGSTPRASPIPIITLAAAGTARPSRALTCARPTRAPQAITRRRARRNNRSRCSLESAARRAGLRGGLSARARNGQDAGSAPREIGRYSSSSKISGRQSASCTLSANWPKRRKLYA